MYTSLLQKVDRDIAAQLKTLGIGEKRPQKFPFPSITISREFGCEGVPVAQHLVKRLSTKENPWVIFHRKLITEITEKDDLQRDLMESVSPEYRGQVHQYIEQLLIHKPTNVQLYKKLAETLRILAMNGRAVILGSGGAILTSDIKNTFHIRLIADMDFKVERVSKFLNLSKSEAKKNIIAHESGREEFIYEFTHKDVRDPHHYHLVINNGSIQAHEIAELIHKFIELKHILPKA